MGRSDVDTHWRFSEYDAVAGGDETVRMLLVPGTDGPQRGQDAAGHVVLAGVCAPCAAPRTRGGLPGETSESLVTLDAGDGNAVGFERFDELGEAMHVVTVRMREHHEQRLAPGGVAMHQLLHGESIAGPMAR